MTNTTNIGDKIYVKIMEGIDYVATRTSPDTFQIAANSTTSMLMAADDLYSKGFRVKKNPCSKEWPMKMYAGAIWWVEGEGEVVTYEEVASEASVAPVESVLEEPDTNTPEAVEQPSEASQEAPDWTAAKSMSKQKLEDYADQWDIQIDTTKTKGVMLDSFMEQWNAKQEG